MLPKYYHHVRTYENTLITKFFGLHRIKPSSGQKVISTMKFVSVQKYFCMYVNVVAGYKLPLNIYDLEV